MENTENIANASTPSSTPTMASIMATPNMTPASPITVLTPPTIPQSDQATATTSPTPPISPSSPTPPTPPTIADIATTITRESIGISLLERYTGSDLAHFQPYVLLTNFEKYVDLFADMLNRRILSGSAMKVCHDEKNGISLINYGVGSPVAALIVELLSFVKPKATIMLGMCGGLRDEYAVGDFFNPVAAIREEGTSMAYMPERCPALSSFVIQRHICEELERNKIKYHNGVIHTTNVRFWEFKEDFKQKLTEERVQAIDMECATLFTVGFASKVPIGALMMITDLPMHHKGIKTKESSKSIFENYAATHLQMGINVLINMHNREKLGFGYQF